MCKEFGDLGIPSLRDLNVSLLASWLKRYIVLIKKSFEKSCQTFKYDTNKPNVFLAKTSEASNFFKGFMWAARPLKWVQVKGGE